ncbi:MAG TPA: arginase family protein, partial [Gemmatales bacterium]|nr:arginase family protein [Gemmatales bacterium]
DAVESVFAPGVSAPAVAGLNVHLWLHAAVSAGRSPHVRSLDLVELNPSLDQDGRTARLAARTLWEFCRGLLDRKS